MKRINPCFRKFWLGLSLIGAILVENPSDRLLLRADPADAPTAPAAPAAPEAPAGPAGPASPAARAEVENAAEAVEAFSAGSKRHGIHFGIQAGEGEIVKIGSNAHVKPGEKVRTLVVIFGNATMEGEVEDNMVVVFGNATVNGTVHGDFVNVMGATTLGPQAKLKQDCVVVGGKLTKEPGAKTDQEPVEVSFGAFWSALEPVGYWFRTGLLLGRPFPPTSGLAWIFVGLHFLLYLIILVLFPKPVDACVKVLETQPLTALLVGLLAMVLAGPLVIILIASGIGLIVVPFVWVAMLLARYVGKAAVLQFMGLQVLRRGNPDTNPRSLLGLLVGTGIVAVLYMVPFLGLLVWGLLLPFALGTALTAAFATFKRNGNGRSAPPAMAMAYAAAPVAATAGGPGVGEAGEPGAGVPLTPVPLSTGGPSLAELAVMPRVGFWLRLAATTRDFLLCSWLIPIGGPLFLPVWLAYHVGLWSWKGTTVGGIICSIRVVRIDGRPVDFGVALVRSLGSVLSFMALCLGFFWAGWSRDRQSWHDTIAGTTIVKVPRGSSLI